MAKFVIFQFLNGSFEQGFPVRVRIGEDGASDAIESSGSLPPAPEIIQNYRRWQDIYFNLGFYLGLPFRLEAPAAQVTNYSSQDCNNAAQLLRHSLNNWLKSESFILLRERVLLTLKADDEVRIFIESTDPQLQKLPWHLCDLFQYFSHSEIVLSVSESIEKKQKISPKTKVKILAIFGSSQGINIGQDEVLLRQLPNSELTFLVKPQHQELNDHLWEQNWSIIFFAGHSSSQDNHEGMFYINETEYLTIENLKYALKKAKKNGLKLAIFNSCDGLGLAQALADLYIPQIIVMREPIPDQIAQSFLKYFLQAFAKNQSFHLAVRQARERLQGLESQFPCATWLPIAYQNPSEKPLKWKDLYKNLLGVRIAIASLGCFALFAIAILIFSEIRETNNTKNRISLGNKILVNSNSVTNYHKEAGTKAFAAGNFQLAVEEFQKSLNIKQNDPETLIYLNNAKISNSKALNIAVSVPIGTRVDVAQEMLRGVAQAQNEVNQYGGINGMGLKIAIANDDNNQKIAKKLAKEFVKNSDILAVIGHNASDVSIAAAEIYQGELAMISPTSFSKNLSQIQNKNTDSTSIYRNITNTIKSINNFHEKDIDNYIFRTIPSIELMANSLAEYTIKTNPKAKIVMCYGADSLDQKTFMNQFAIALYDNKVNENQIEVINDVKCELFAPNFNPSAVISQAIKSGADSLLLSPHIHRINEAIELTKANQGRLKLLASPTLYTSETLESGQESVNEMVLAVPWHPEAFPGNPFPSNAAKLWGGNVNWRTATAYDATQAIILGLDKSNNTRDGLQKVLSSNWFSVNGATGNFQFLPSGGDRLGKSFLIEVKPSNKAGKYEFVLLK